MLFDDVVAFLGIAPKIVEFVWLVAGAQDEAPRLVAYATIRAGVKARDGGFADGGDVAPNQRQ
jgi:hypothetical protein